MADQSKAAAAEEEEDEDYMGDISLFIPPCTQTSSSSNLPNSKKHSFQTTTSQSNPNKKPKTTLNWQERRRLDRERKQREEDEQTIANIQSSAIPQTNIGFKMLKQMGYNPGSGGGCAEPVGLVEIRRSRAGIGREDPVKEKERKDEWRGVMEKKQQEELMSEFEYRQKAHWRGRRVRVNFDKAKGVLDQLENKEVVVPQEEDEEEGEEEEEDITEEDLQGILTTLRDEHRYCLFCGFQYDSKEALLASCPGIDEDDH